MIVGKNLAEWDTIFLTTLNKGEKNVALVGLAENFYQSGTFSKRNVVLRTLHDPKVCSR